MGRLSRRERERERIRQEILEAAEQEFSQSGFRDTIMSAIAARVELSVGTLYNFFPSKDALFITLMDTKATEFLHSEEEQVRKIKCPLEKIRFILRNTCKILLENLNFFRLIFDIKTEKNMPAIEKEHPLITVKLENHLRFMAGLFREAMEAGMVKPMPPMLLAVCLESLTFGLIEKWDHVKDLARPEKIIADLESAFLEGILASK
ncbi:MAG: helix-turn-helix transcriptional regulator [Candidatus Glassbacteria bacterium]|nr:helix-turn-helix transcriptional regulator [Candidatus Glassbacteria bacterium]